MGPRPGDSGVLHRATLGGKLKQKWMKAGMSWCIQCRGCPVGVIRIEAGMGQGCSRMLCTGGPMVGWLELRWSAGVGVPECPMQEVSW